MFDWIQIIADYLVYDALHLHKEQHLAEALNFFIYDSIKILVLLFIVMYLMGIVNSYFPIDKVKNFLSKNKLYGLEYFVASFFGAVTPFCSCSSVPLFIGFVRGGIPLGVTFSFLITSPLVNEVAIGLFISLFGIKTTIIYVASGLLLGTISGILLQALKLEKHLTPWVKNILATSQDKKDSFIEEKKTLKQRLPIITNEVFYISKGILPYVLVGIAIGGLIHGYVPEAFFENHLDKDNLLAVPIATIIAIPLYSNASGILPIIHVLVTKGIPIGTAISFMMGVVGLSLPEAMLLKKVMTLKLIALFFGVVTICIIISGYIFNLVL